jgi:hypothetical protein
MGLFRALGALVRMAVSSAATLAALGALAAPIALLLGVRSGAINSSTVKQYGLEGAFDWERPDGMARRAMEALRAAAPQPPPHTSVAPVPAQSEWLRFPEARRWGEGLAALTRQQPAAVEDERDPTAPGLVQVAAQWWDDLRGAAAPLWDGARRSGASAASWATQHVAAWSTRVDVGSMSSGAGSGGPASGGAAGGLSADEAEELRRYRMLAERERQHQLHQHPLQPARGLPAVVAKVGGIPAALGKLQDTVVEWLSGGDAGAASELAGTRARLASAGTSGTGPVAVSEPLGPGPGELARAAAAAASERAAATLSAVKVRLSDAASLPGVMVEELQQRLSQPSGKSAPNKGRPVTSGREALLEQAVLRRQLALEMPALQVDPRGQLDRVQRMLDGHGQPYDPEIPWAG